MMLATPIKLVARVVQLRAAARCRPDLRALSSSLILILASSSTSFLVI